MLNKQKLLQELLLVQQKQGNLSGRVAILEVQRASWKSKAYVFVGQTGSRLTYVAKFVRKLFPEMKSSEGLKALFDVIYEHKKTFRSYVNKKMREVLTPLLQMDACRKIRKHFAPWRFLQVMDCSKQSLNQVRVCAECYLH